MRFTDGSDTPRAYLERCIARIEALEPTVMAFAFLNLERARQAADESTARYRAARSFGPVDGMPVGIKDLIDTHDMPTEYGSELFAGHRPIADAATVRALRLGGAVLVGKTVTVCFGGGDPARTRNPFDTRRTPGGSSSGSAAAVAAGMLPAALGTHARGSTIRPASFCGVYALKPTFGAMSACSAARCRTCGLRPASSLPGQAAIRPIRDCMVHPLRPAPRNRDGSSVSILPGGQQPKMRRRRSLRK